MQLLKGTAKESLDLEAQDEHEVVEEETTTKPASAEYSVPTSTKLLHLGGYFFLNLALTLYNKALLRSFSFPWLLTALHSSSAAVGCYVLLMRGHFRLTRLGTREKVALIGFSFLFTLNIAMSNVSLNLVSVPFHQIMRSTCPIFTIIIYRVFYSRTYSFSTYLSLAPIILGVGLATYGDYYFSAIGFTLTLSGVVLAAIKTIVSNRMMTGSLALPPLEFLLRMSPLAAVQSLVYALVTGELQAFIKYAAEGHITTASWFGLLGNGFLAFLLNVSSFSANKLAGALTMTVCANVKQCLTILLGILAFDVRVGLINGLGIAVALAGAALYSKVELDSKGKKKETSNGDKPSS
ncbi:TPT-domain-containing protein [Saccharata proteae CBS 121410]|uniref:TPT-domain-containing protein n=1 Tax=Saccharata proteae CBS 121410 TaxID=1314787 RepID=A0A9P4HNV9_9PEZI|nr:TPT-domain-containing protein [Saccharata proteae CBS 121410]